MLKETGVSDTRDKCMQERRAGLVIKEMEKGMIGNEGIWALYVPTSHTVCLVLSIVLEIGFD